MGKKSNSSSSSSKIITPKNNNQKHLIQAIETSPMVITLGPAGTGKTFLTACKAAEFLKAKRVRKIVLTRPTVPTGRSIGFFPGDLSEKMNPWCIPVLKTLEECLGKGAFETNVKNGNIEIVPFETIRGRSFENTFVILDEAQNATIEEIKAFTTRIGNYSVAVINGDITQTDIGFASGLKTIIEIARNSEQRSRYCPVVEFTVEDIVRSGLCQLWVEEFEEYESQNQRTFSDHNAPSFLLEPRIGSETFRELID